jgi:hypothetical protein
MMLDRFVVEDIEGEPLRFLVDSRSRVEMKHLVDLEELNGRGRCGCEHFSIRLDKEKHLTCDHVKAAQIHLAKKVVRQYSATRASRKGDLDDSAQERSHEARAANGHKPSAVSEGQKAVPPKVYGLSGRSMAPRREG